MSLILLAIFVVICDQLLKFTLDYLLTPGQSIPLIKNFFHITLVHNTGAAFGILKNQTTLFMILSILASLVIVYYIPKLGKKAVLTRLALALILGGAVGNLVDRVRLGYVIDFLDFRVWPVFNIADSAITIGAILFIIGLLRKK